MTGAEKMLYHQIHPVKLTADIASCVISCALLWQHQLAVGMLVAWLPAIAASLLVTRFTSLERQQESAFGRYLSAAMTPAVMAQRMAGQIIMWLAAWQHAPVVMAMGALVIVLAWLSGLPAKRGR
jgi:hypothetical protein